MGEFGQNRHIRDPPSCENLQSNSISIIFHFATMRDILIGIEHFVTLIVFLHIIRICIEHYINYFEYIL